MNYTEYGFMPQRYRNEIHAPMRYSMPTIAASDHLRTRAALRARIRMRARRALLACVVSVVLLVMAGGMLASSAAAAPPANDNLANAMVIPGPGGIVTSNTGEATAEVGEPYHDDASARRTVWFQWLAPSSGPVRITTIESAFDTTLAVYTGSSYPLTLVTENDDSPHWNANTASEVNFTAVSNTTYRIAVDGYHVQEGYGAVQLLLDRGVVANDAFAGATEVTLGSTTRQYIRGAGRQGGEPQHEPTDENGPSVWFTYTPGANGPVTVTTHGSAFDTVMAVYTGSSVGALTQVVRNDDVVSEGGRTSAVTWNATVGVTYRIAVAHYDDDQDDLYLQLNVGTAAFDDMADARPVKVGFGTWVDNVLATKEAGEVDHAGLPGNTTTVWHEFTAISNGLYSVDTIAMRNTGSGRLADTVLAVYDAGGGLMASNDDWGDWQRSRVTFTATRGARYLIATTGKGTATGQYAVRVGESDRSSNDDFADAIDLTSAGGNFTRTVEQSFDTVEAGEPVDGARRGASQWFTWTAPAGGGRMHIYSTSRYPSGRTRAVGAQWEAYTGASLGSLTSVTYSGISCTSPAIPAEESGYFDAVGGTTYYLQVMPTLEFGLWFHGLAESNLYGRFTAPTPANDDLAGALNISGAQHDECYENYLATTEPGEPDHDGVAAEATMWWTWTATATGVAQLQTYANLRQGALSDTTLAVYGPGVTMPVAGSALAANDDVGLGANPQQSAVTFNAVMGTTYRIAVGGSGNTNGWFDLQLNPTPGNATNVRDGLGADVDLANVVQANWTNPTGQPLSGVDWCVDVVDSSGDAACSGGAVASGQELGAAVTSLTVATPIADGDYFMCVRPHTAFVTAEAYECSDGFELDQTVAAPGVVRDGPTAGVDIDQQDDQDYIDATWTGVTDPNGLNRYEYCYSTATGACGGAWTSAGAATSLHVGSLALPIDVHYVCVRAVDGVGNMSDETCSDGVHIGIAPVLELTLSTLGYDAAARDTPAPGAIDFPDVLPGSSVAIGPGDSGQATAGSAVHAEATCSKACYLEAYAAPWSGPAAMDIGDTLAWRPFGSTDPWTPFEEGGDQVHEFPVGTSSQEFEVQASVPAGQDAGTYSTTVEYTLIVPG